VPEIEKSNHVTKGLQIETASENNLRVYYIFFFFSEDIHILNIFEVFSDSSLIYLCITDIIDLNRRLVEDNFRYVENCPKNVL